MNPPSIEEAYVIPQFGDWLFAFTRIDAVYVWTQGSYHVGREPDDYPLFLAVLEADIDAWQRFSEQFGNRQDLSADRKTRLKALSKSSSMSVPCSTPTTSKDIQSSLGARR
nr:hypothetical protein [Natrinema ejinorense]